MANTPTSKQKTKPGGAKAASAEPKKPATPGRPRKISTPEEFDAGVDSYVAKCREKEEPILLLGMCLHLGLYGKEALAEYAGYEEFSLSVKRARAIIEMEYEKRLVTNSSAAGPIFALKNFNWTDKTEVDQTVKSDAKVEVTGTIEVPGLADRFAKLKK